MSWDLVLQHADAHPLGEADSVRALISSVHPAVDWSDPAWGTLDSGHWSIELNIGDSPIVHSIMLHVRGSGDPLPAIAALCTKTGWDVLDLSSGELLDPRDPSPRGWVEFQAFRDGIRSLVETGDPATLRRSRLRLEDATLVRTAGRSSGERYELAAFTEVRFDRGTNWASVVLAMIALGIGIFLKIVIPIAWLGWLCAALLVGLALLFAITARTDILVLRAADRKIVVPLVDTPDEIRAFKVLVIDALNAGD